MYMVGFLRNINLKISAGRVVILFIMALLVTGGLYAQVPITVEGQIFIQTENEKGEDVVEPISPDDVMLFYFDSYTEAIGRADELKADLNAVNNWTFVQRESVELDGTFVVYDALTGGGLLACGLAIGSEPKVIRLTAADGDQPVRIVLKSEGVTVAETVITGQSQAVGADPAVAEQFGNILYINNANLTIPAHVGKTNARLVICPFVYNHDKKDTAHFRAPRVYTGKEFYMSQKRHVGFDENKDPLFKYNINEPFDDQRHKYVWSDTVVCPNAKDNFQVLGRYYFEDYLGVYREDSVALTSKFKRKPMRFLQYEVSMYELDPMKYKDEPKVERREGSEDISLSFKIGQAELNPDDPNNEVELKKLEDKIYGLVNDRGAQLKRIAVSSVSSPDGSYALNYNLAVRRLAFARDLIRSKIPASKMRGVVDLTNTAKSARVAKWTELADILYADTVGADAALKDSLVNVALKINDIAAQYSNHDAQSVRIARLPEYNSLIKRYLPKLRSMKFEYVAQIYRALTSEEIMDKYNDYKSKGVEEMVFEPYEYWHLFQMVKDSMELEKLYRLAYKSTIKYYKGEVAYNVLFLAANNLALSYMRRDTCDYKILEPLINRKVAGVNVPRTTISGEKYIVNRLEILANQLIMYLKNDDYEQAAILAKMLKSRQGDDERLKQMIAITYCLRGYYKITPDLSETEKNERREYFNIVSKSSPVNEVVMALAMNSSNYNQLAIELLKEMSFDDPLICYLRAIAYGRSPEYFNDAMTWLQRCFLKDEKYIDIARTDGDIPEELFATAFDMYEVEKELMELNGGF